jgi:hypothetical protein
MASFFLWCILLIVCWPLALLALVAYPFVWLLLLPFRIVRAILFLPVRVLRGPYAI